MPIDTSLYKVPKGNVLQDIGAIAGIANQVNQNRLFQQQFMSNLAAGEAYRGAMGPQGLDTNQLMRLLANSPAAYTLPQVMRGVQEQKQRQIGIETQQMELAQKRLTALRSALGSVLANPQATSRDVVNALSQLTAQGVVTPQMSATTLASMPQDPEGMRRWLTEQLVNTMSAQEKLNVTYGEPEMMEGVDPQTGAPVKRPVAVSPLFGARNMPVQGEMGAGRGGDGSAAATTGAFQTGLAPGRSKAMESSATAWAALRDDVGQSAQRLFQLREALTALGKARTGKSSTWRNDLISTAITYGWTDDPEQLSRTAAYDKANKYLTQYAMNQAGQLGSGTDAKLSAALTGNASTEISNLAARDVVKANIALERMKQAQALAFEESGLPAGGFSDWAVKWNRDMDPRAFAIDLMEPKDVKKMVNSLKGPAQKKFVASVTRAINAGLIDPEAIRNANSPPGP